MSFVNTHMLLFWTIQNEIKTWRADWWAKSYFPKVSWWPSCYMYIWTFWALPHGSGKSSRFDFHIFMYASDWTDWKTLKINKVSTERYQMNTNLKIKSDGILAGNKQMSTLIKLSLSFCFLSFFSWTQSTVTVVNIQYCRQGIFWVFRSIQKITIQGCVPWRCYLSPCYS